VRVKYLITGHSGFVGSYLVDAIRRATPEATIIAVDRVARSPGIEFDLLDLDAVLGLLAREQPDRLIHLASFSSVGAS
jgi:nucleoside-diphosphate-sugar epimerase